MNNISLIAYTKLIKKKKLIASTKNTVNFITLISMGFFLLNQHDKTFSL